MMINADSLYLLFTELSKYQTALKYCRDEGVLLQWAEIPQLRQKYERPPLQHARERVNGLIPRTTAVPANLTTVITALDGN